MDINKEEGCARTDEDEDEREVKESDPERERDSEDFLSADVLLKTVTVTSSSPAHSLTHSLALFSLFTW
ncbi:hypothetical protein E2C01_050210 [Portunus trituberculatus]|uniref:Uncharacterized protein n=1 Tax=Portunus trituberculatus TaxID=210409 RepID=A0A5B7GG37_PORTR|nr:hypothetical protein [Portunus trituberculatus]